MDIAVWLRSLSLEQYEAAFRDNAIDADVLHDLTDQDLEKLGVLLGHRRRLLRAIAALDGTVATSSASAPLQVKPSPAAEAAGDRRHVTVMFCDLVDSTGIAAKLGAEEWFDLLGTYVDVASAAITELGGKIIRKQGDGLMVLFGYPVALENDAERAARAALAIHRSLAELNRKNAGTGKPALAARVAIDWGPVLVEGNELFGDAPNIAARAQTVAEAGEVVVTARVQRQIAVRRVLREIAHVGNLLSTEACAAERLVCRLFDCLGCRNAARHEIEDATVNRGRGLRRELLRRDRAHERGERIERRRIEDRPVLVLADDGGENGIAPHQRATRPREILRGHRNGHAPSVCATGELQTAAGAS